MLKEELEKQIDCEFSQKAYAAINADYEASDFNNNREYCDALKTDRIFMAMVEEVKTLRAQIQVIKQTDTNVAYRLLKLASGFCNEDRSSVDTLVRELLPFKDIVTLKLRNSLYLSETERKWAANYIDNAVEL